MLGLVGLSLLIPWAIKLLVDTITAPGASMSDMPYVTRLTVVVLLVFIARAGLQFVRSYEAHVAGWGVVADVRKYIYDHMQRLSLRFYEDKQVGQLMSNVVNDTDLFEQFIAHALPDVVVNAVTLIAVTAVLFSLNWQADTAQPDPHSAGHCLPAGVCPQYVRPAFRNRQQQLGDLNALLNDNLAGIREIKSFTREEDESQRVYNRIDNYRTSLLKALRLMAIFQPFVDFTSSTGHVDCHILRRDARLARDDARFGAGGVLPVSGKFLRPCPEL